MFAHAEAALDRAHGGFHRDAEDQDEPAQSEDQDDAQHAEGLNLARVADQLRSAEALHQRVIRGWSFEHTALPEILRAHGKLQRALLKPGETRGEPVGKLDDPLIVGNWALDVLIDRFRGCFIDQQGFIEVPMIKRGFLKSPLRADTPRLKVLKYIPTELAVEA